MSTTRTANRSTTLTEDVDDVFIDALNQTGEKKSQFLRNAIIMRLHMGNDEEFIESARSEMAEELGLESDDQLDP